MVLLSEDIVGVCVCVCVCVCVNDITLLWKNAVPGGQRMTSNTCCLAAACNMLESSKIYLWSLSATLRPKLKQVVVKPLMTLDWVQADVEDIGLGCMNGELLGSLSGLLIHSS